MNYTIHRFDSVTSTNDLAAGMAGEGAPEGTVVIAREQTAGRGRHGRTWLSPEGGLYLSIVLRPDIPADRLRYLSFVASLASAEAIANVSGIPARVKWPNDVFLNSRKVCGILLENGQFRAERPTFNVQRPTSNDKSEIRNPKSEINRFITVGVGVNVEAAAMPEEFEDKATSVCAESGRSISPFDIEEALLESLNRRYHQFLEDGFEPILDAWKLFDCTTGREIEAHTSEGTIKGKALEIDSAGRLVIRTPTGGIISITSGDIIL